MHKIILQLITITVLLFIISCKNNNNSGKVSYDPIKIKVDIGGNKSEVYLNYDVIKQEASKRLWKTLEKELLFTIGGIEDTTLLHPYQVKIDEEKNIYILDMKDNGVKKFNPKGRYLKKYGRTGAGPGEFINAFRFDLLKKNELAILDGNGNKIEIFDENQIKQIKCRYMPSNLCFGDKENIIVLQIANPIEDSPIRVYNIETKEVKDFEPLLRCTDTDAQIGMLPFMDGNLNKYENKGFVYVPHQMNHFVIYNSKGKIENAFNTIDNIKTPDYHQKRQNVINFNVSYEKISALRSGIFEDILFIESGKAIVENKAYVIDLYSLKNGNYLYSFKLPKEYNKKVTNIILSKERLYIVKKNSEVEVLKYKFK